MSFLDLTLLARATVKVASFSTPKMPDLAKPPAPPKLLPAPTPKLDVKPPAPPPMPTSPVVQTPPMPAQPQHQSPFGMFGQQSPEGLAGLMTSPMFQPISQTFLGGTGLAGLGFLSSAFGKDQMNSWNTLTQGSVFPKESANAVAPDLEQLAEDAANKGPLGGVLGGYSKLRSNVGNTIDNLTGKQDKGGWGGLANFITGPGAKTQATSRSGLLWDNRGNLAETATTYGVGDKVLSNLAAKPSIATIGKDIAGNKMFAPAEKGWRTFFKPEEFSNASSRLFSRTAPKGLQTVARAAKPIAQTAGRIAGRLGGAFATPISAAMEGYDILKHGYKLDEFRNTVAPDGTVLGKQTDIPGMSYLGSALNASMNPIRSSHLLYKDTKSLFTGDDKLDSLKQISDRSKGLDSEIRDNWADRVNKIQAKAKQVGYAGLSSGERSDLKELSNPHRKTGPGFWQGFWSGW